MAKPALTISKPGMDPAITVVHPKMSPNSAKSKDRTAGKTANNALIQALDDESPGPKRTDQNVIPHETKGFASHNPPSKDSSPLQPYSHSTSITRSEIVTLATLEKLIRQRPVNMHQIFFNLESRNLPTLFGKFGFDSSFLNVFLDAIGFMQVNEPNWVTRSVSLLDSIRHCGRFNIAVTFTSVEKISAMFATLESRAGLKEKKKVQEVKRFYTE